MRKYFFLSAFVLLFFACNTKKQDSSLAGIFLESLDKENFDLLKPHLPTVEFYKGLGSSAPERSDSDIVKFLEGSNERLKANWEKIRERIKSASIDLSGIDIKEAIVYSPFKEKELQAMVVVYDYNKKTWDDISFIISNWNEKTYLLEIPNHARFLSMEDSTLRASSEAKLSNEMSKPEFKKSVQDKVEKLISYAKDKKEKEFTENVVYRGDDESRRWKSAIMMSDTAEAGRATDFINQVNAYVRDCPDRTFDEIKIERESEGTWIVMPVGCGKSIVYFAFLRVNGELLLGDVDVTMTE